MPDWRDVAGHNGSAVLCNRLQDWFDKNVAPVNVMLSEGVEVVGQIKNIDGGLSDRKYWCATQITNNDETHTGLLINIQPIHQPTREEKGVELALMVMDSVIPGDKQEAALKKLSKYIDSQLKELMDES